MFQTKTITIISLEEGHQKRPKRCAVVNIFFELARLCNTTLNLSTTVQRFFAKQFWKSMKLYFSNWSKMIGKEQIMQKILYGGYISNYCRDSLFTLNTVRRSEIRKQGYSRLLWLAKFGIYQIKMEMRRIAFCIWPKSFLG